MLVIFVIFLQRQRLPQMASLLYTEKDFGIFSKFYSVMGVALVPDHFQLISNILPRQLKLTNQKTPVMVDVETNEDNYRY